MSLQLTPAVDQGTLTVEFSLHNPLEVDIYVDQYQPTRDWPPERRGYVYVHREDRLLVLYFGTVPNPPLVRLAQEMKFYTERLAPAQTLHAAIRLPLPVLENGKLALADAAAPHEVVEVDRVRCTVCYTPKTRGMKIEEAAPNSALYVLRDSKAIEASATVHLLQPVRALRRSDRFDLPFDPARAAI